MALKTWAQLASNEAVAHAEVRDAVTNGQLAWLSTEQVPAPADPSRADHYCYLRQDYETIIRHNSMATSGIASNDLMSKAEMIAYRDLTVPAEPVPTSFYANQTGICPLPTMTLTWSNGSTSEQKTLQYHNGSTWVTLSSTIAASATSYVWSSPPQGTISMRIRFNSRSTWANASALITCIE
jgi:hypothetical protein